MPPDREEVMAASSAVWVMPGSVSTLLPSVRSIMWDGVTSRWYSPFSCRYASASAMGASVMAAVLKLICFPRTL